MMVCFADLGRGAVPGPRAVFGAVLPLVQALGVAEDGALRWDGRRARKRKEKGVDAGARARELVRAAVALGLVFMLPPLVSCDVRERPGPSGDPSPGGDVPFNFFCFFLSVASRISLYLFEPTDQAFVAPRG